MLSKIPSGGFRTASQLKAALAVHANARLAYTANPSKENAAKVRAALRQVEREQLAQRSFANRL